jgi:hypothetical protein
MQDGRKDENNPFNYIVHNLFRFVNKNASTIDCLFLPIVLAFTS